MIIMENDLKKNMCVLFQIYIYIHTRIRDSPGGSDGKASACNAGGPDSIPGLGRFPGEGDGNPLQYSCLESPMDGGAWWATVHRVAKSRTRLSDFSSLAIRWAPAVWWDMRENRVDISNDGP